MAVEPVVYGASARAPRGDYTRASADYTCAQNHAQYTAGEHDTYRRLYARQEGLLPGVIGCIKRAYMAKLCNGA